MDKEEKGLWATAAGFGLVFLLAVAVKLAFWVAVVWAIVKLVQHFVG